MNLIEKYLGEGEMKVAMFYKKTHELKYWTSKNTTTNINSGVEQKLEIG